MVTERGVQDRYRLLSGRFKRKNNAERRASGINPDFSELDSLLQDVIDLERDSTALLQQEELKKRKNSKKNPQVPEKDVWNQ